MNQPQQLPIPKLVTLELEGRSAMVVMESVSAMIASNPAAYATKFGPLLDGINQAITKAAEDEAATEADSEPSDDE